MLIPVFLYAFRLNINPWFYQGMEKKPGQKNLYATLVMVWRPHHEDVTWRFFNNEERGKAYGTFQLSV